MIEPRIGNAEREVATARLGEHYAAGRLDHEEYDERLDAVWSARTKADLDQLFWDLPWAANPPAAPVRTYQPASRKEQAGSWVFIIAALMVAAMIFGVVAHVPWWLWVLGIILLVKRPWARTHRARR